MKPNLFIIGAPKAGTTSLAYYLDQHKDVVVANPKEPNFFCKDITRNYCSANSLQEYVSNCFPNNYLDYKIVCDASVSSLYSKNAVDEIIKFNPQAMFIVMLRHPIDIVSSLHQQLVNARQEDILNFETAWYIQEKRLTGKEIPASCQMPLALQYGEFGKIGYQLDRLYKKVNKEKVKIIFYEDFSINTFGELESVLDFLGLSINQEIDLTIKNESSGKKSYSLDALVYFISKIKLFLGVKKSFGILKGIERYNFSTQKRKPLSKVFINKFKIYYKDDIKLLEKITKRDLTNWYQY